MSVPLYGRAKWRTSVVNAPSLSRCRAPTAAMAALVTRYGAPRRIGRAIGDRTAVGMTERGCRLLLDTADMPVDIGQADGGVSTAPGVPGVIAVSKR